MKTLFRVLIVLLLLFSLPANAQTVYTPKHAKASLQVLTDKIKVGKNGKACFQFKITPFEDYVIYSLKEKNGAPISIKTPKLDGFVFGLPKEYPLPEKLYDDGFETDVYIHKSSSTITIPVRVNTKVITSKQQEIEIVASFQTISYKKGHAFNDEISLKFYIFK